MIQDEGTVKADQGTVDYDQVQLAYCHIVSPITGRVGLRLVDPGNTVFSGSSLHAGGDYPAAADHGGLQRLGGRPAAGAGAVEAADTRWRWMPSTAPTKSRSKPES